MPMQLIRSHYLAGWPVVAADNAGTPNDWTMACNKGIGSEAADGRTYKLANTTTAAADAADAIYS